MIAQLYQAYLTECQKTDGDRHGAILREMTPREAELYRAWRAARENCTTWRDPETGTSWHVLSRYQDHDLEMWRCRIEETGKPAVIAPCYAAYVRELAQPVDE